MTSAESPGPDSAPLRVGRASRPLRRWVWFGLAAVGLGAAAFTITAGLGNRILSVLGIILFLDLISGSFFICFFIFFRLVLPLVITVALVPFSLIWPGDSGEPHWTTVRGRFQGIGRMWRGYWGIDREGKTGT